MLCLQAAYSAGRSLVWGLDSSPLSPSCYSHLAQLRWCPQGWAWLPNTGCPALSTGVREGKWVLLVCAEVPVIGRVGSGSARRPYGKNQAVPACTTKGLTLCLEFGIGSSFKVPSNPYHSVTRIFGHGYRGSSRSVTTQEIILSKQ